MSKPVTKSEREELRKIIAEARDVCHCGQYVDEHTESDNHAALAMDTQESDRLTAACLEAMPRLLDALDAAEAERDALRAKLEQSQKDCDESVGQLDDISAYSGYAVSIDDDGEFDGSSLVEFVRDLVAERDALRAELAAANARLALLPSEEEIQAWSSDLNDANNDNRPSEIDQLRRAAVALMRRARGGSNG